MHRPQESPRRPLTSCTAKTIVGALGNAVLCPSTQGWACGGHGAAMARSGITATPARCPQGTAPAAGAFFVAYGHHSRRRKPPVQKTAQVFHLSQRNRASTTQSQGPFFSYFPTPDHRISRFDRTISRRACLWARLNLQRMSFSYRSVFCNNFHLISRTIFDSTHPIPIKCIMCGGLCSTEVKGSEPLVKLRFAALEEDSNI